MTIRIVTDSTCDIPAETAAELGISVIPCFINMNETSYLDGINLSRQDFYKKLPACTVAPTTSAPGIAAFVDTYNRLAQDGATHIISIHVSANFSNIYNVAQLASQSVKENIPVTVIDSGQLTLGMGFSIVKAAMAAITACSLEEILKIIKSVLSRSYTLAVLETLEYLQRSGRVSKLQNALGTLLKIDPFVKVFCGDVFLERVRTYSKSLERMLKTVNELAPLDDLAILHTAAMAKAEELKDQVKYLFPADKKVWIVEATPAIGTHVGPGAVGLAFVRKG